MAHEVGRVKHVDVQAVAFDPLAAIQQAAEVAQRSYDLDAEGILQGVDRAHLVGDGTDSADPRGDVRRLRVLAAAQEREVGVCIIEKGSEVGAHILSGAVLETRALDELIPDWKEQGAPVTTATMSPSSIAVADLDSDGKLDLLSTSAGDDKVAWYANDAAGIFGAQMMISDFVDWPIAKGAWTGATGPTPPRTRARSYRSPPR